MVPAFAQARTGRLVAIASRRPGAALDVLAGHPEVHVHRDYAALLADEAVDAVYIPAAGDEHRLWAIAAAKAGKHVLCEKPLALNVAEALEMQRACQMAGVLLMEAFMWRHHPRALKVRELVSTGAIGTLRMIHVSFSFDIDRTDWRLDPVRGGGAIWDLGCYGVNCTRFLTDEEPNIVHSQAVRGPSGADMTTHVALAFPSQVLANIDCSFEAPFRCRVEVVGTAGQLLLERAFQNEPGCTLSWTQGAHRDAPTHTLTFPDVNQYSRQIDHFSQSIHEGRLLEPAEDGVANMRVMEAIVSKWPT